MGTANLINLQTKISNLENVSNEEIQNALYGININPDFFIYKILFQNYVNFLYTDDILINNTELLNYYENLTIQIINLFPELYFIEDKNLYSKFALINYLNSNPNSIANNINLILELLEDIEKEQIEYLSLKWYIQQTLKNYLLRYYIFTQKDYQLIKILVEELSTIEKDYLDLLNSLEY